jgi:hypothetical protein
MHKVNKKKTSSCNIAWKAELSIISSNCFSPLNTLKVNQEDEELTVNNSENIPTSSNMKNNIYHKTDNKIPTVLNGIVKIRDIQDPSKATLKFLGAKHDTEGRIKMKAGSR